MKADDFLKNYQKLQHGIMFDDLIDLEFATVGYSKIDKSPFWNFGLTNKILIPTELKKVEETLLSLDRKSTIYFENGDSLKPLSWRLKDNGYQLEFEDCWQFWDGNKIDETRFDLVKKVDSLELLNEFLNTFDACYQKDDPQNPYGELGEYLETAKELWHKHHQSNRLEYFIVYDGEGRTLCSSHSD